MRTFILFLLFWFSAIVTFSQSRFLIPYRVGNLYGYADTNRVIIIQPKYDFTDMFFRGFGVVVRNKLLGVIDTAGKELIPPVYEELNDCCNEMVMGKKEGKYGVISLKDGSFILPFVYNRININGYSFIYQTLNKSGLMGMYDGLNRKWLLREKYNDIQMDSSGTDILYYTAKGTGLEERYSVTINHKIMRVRNLKAPYQEPVHNADSDLPPQQEMLDENLEGEIVETTTGSFTENHKMGWRMKEVKNGVVTIKDIPAVYDTIYPISKSDSLFMARKDGREGIINWKNQTIFPFLYEAVEATDSSAIHGIYIVREKGKLGLATPMQMVLPCIYDRIFPAYAVSYPGFSLGIGDKSGAWFYKPGMPFSGFLLPVVYDVVHGLRFVQDADFNRKLNYSEDNKKGKYFVFVVKDGKRGYVDLEGKEYFSEKE